MNKVRLGLLSLAASLAIVFLQSAIAQQQPPAQVPQREQATQQQPATAPAMPQRQSVTEDMLFRDNSRIVGRVSIPDQKLSYLEQPQGRTWRRFHERWAPWILGAAILVTLIILLLLYLWRGPVRYDRDSPDASVRVLRYSGFERFNHWMTAVSFIVLALTGVNYVFGKRLLMPLIGPGAFGDVTQISKYAHNFFAWPFILGVLTMIIVWLRPNLPRREDWQWLRAGGGMFGSTGHLSAGRFNAGQKILYWLVVLSTLVMFASGLMLLMPLAYLDVNGMQISSAVHSIAGALFIAMILAHIYIGTAGTQGAFSGMGTGEVDLAWARHHHDLWARDAQVVDRAGVVPDEVAPVRPTPTRNV